MLHAVPNGRKIFEKHGAKSHGVWLTEAGGWCELYTLLEWPSLEKRIAMRQSSFKDPEIIAHWNTVGRFMLKGENFICKANSKVPFKAFSPNRPIWVNRIKPQKFDVFATLKLMELCGIFEKHFAPDISPVHTILHPVAYPDHCIWAIWEIGENQQADRLMSKIAAAYQDPSNWAHMEETREAFEIQSAVVATPIHFDQLPPLDKMQ